MGNKTRIFSAIFHCEGIRVRELSRLLNIGLPTIDHHLKAMGGVSIVSQALEEGIIV